MLSSAIHRALRRARSPRGEDGFTLVEILVVIVIIGILAAIALTQLLGQEDKGHDASAKSDARNVVSLVESCHAETNSYAQCQTVAQLGSSSGVNLVDGIPASGEVGVSIAGPPAYIVTAVSQGGRSFAISKAGDGTLDHTCSPVGGGCRPGGTW